MNILIFGDSITYGAWDKEGGWAQRLRKQLDGKNLSDPDKYHYQVYNLGISGNTTEDLLKRFDFEAEQRLEEDEENMVIFSIGINDSAFISSENNNWITLDDFEKNINALIGKARKFSQEITFIGLIPCEEEKTQPVPWAPDVSYKNSEIEKYNGKIKEVCQKENVKFIDLRGEFISMDYKKILFDGLHPNSAGHQWIAEKIIKELKL